MSAIIHADILTDITSYSYDPRECQFSLFLQQRLDKFLPNEVEVEVEGEGKEEGEVERVMEKGRRVGK